MSDLKQKDLKDLVRSNGTCKMLADFFFILSNPTRIALFCSLSEGAKSVSQLAEDVDKTIQNVSQHLRLMREKNLVCTAKQGQQIFYSIADARFVDGCRLIRDASVDQMHKHINSLEL